MTAILRLVRRSLDHPYTAVAAAGLCFAAAVAALPRLTVAVDGRRLFAPSHPAVLADAGADRQYGPAHQLIIAVVAASEETLFDPRALDLVWRVTSRASHLVGVDGRRTRSLSTVMAPVSTPDGLLVSPPIDGPQLAPVQAAAVRARVLGDSLLRGTLLSRDRRGTLITVPLSPAADPLVVLDGIREILRDVEPDARAANTRLELTGSVAAEALLGEHVLADLVTVLPAAFGVIAVCLAIWFRSRALVLAGLGEAMLIVSVTLGLMAISGRPLSLVSIVMPVILASYCVSDTVHVAQRYMLLRERVGSARAAVEQATAELIRPIVFTSVTTAASFFALAWSPIPAMRDFGVFTAAGVLFAAAVSLLVVPPALALLQPAVSPASLRVFAPVRSRLEAGASWTASHPMMTVLTALVLTAAAGLGTLRLVVQDSWIGNFSAGSDIRRSVRWLNEQMEGSGILRVVLHAAPDEPVTDPRFLARLDAFAERLRTRPEVGGVVTVADHMRSVGRLIGAGDRTPRTAGEAEEWWLLLESAGGAETMTAYVDDRRRAACVWVYLRDPNYRRVSSLLTSMEESWGKRPEYGGDAYLGYALVDEIAVSLKRSMLLAALLIAILVWLMLRSVRGTLVAVAPVTLAVVWNFSALGWLGIPIGVATATFSALAFGIGVDFALHWLERHRVAVGRQESAVAAFKDAAAWAGPAIVAQSGLLVAAFGVLLASRVPPVRHLGLLMCTSLAICAVATLLVVPALQALLWREPRLRTSAAARLDVADELSR